MIIPHNKLVRDNIPQIIENNGQSAKMVILDDEKYTDALKKKLKEEGFAAIKIDCESGELIARMDIE